MSNLCENPGIKCWIAHSHEVSKIFNSSQIVTILILLLRYAHNKEEEKEFECKHCQKKFSRKQQLKNHLLTHSSERPHMCEICSLTFKSVVGLNRHMKRHNGSVVKNVECNECGKKFYTPYNLNEHMKTHTGMVRRKFN